MKTEIAVALIGAGATIGAVFLKKYLPIKPKQTMKDPKLMEHPFFMRMESLKNHIKMDLVLENKGKEVVFKDLLENKFDIFISQLKEMTEEIESCCETCNSECAKCPKLYNIQMKHFRKSLDSFNSYYKNSQYSDDEQKALMIVRNKFNKWNVSRIEYIESSISDICNSIFYKSCKVKSAAILDMYLGAFIDTINDAEKTLNEINGDMKGLIFRGIKI